jgi:hypothetical protein
MTWSRHLIVAPTKWVYPDDKKLGPTPENWPDARKLARRQKTGPTPENWPDARKLARRQKTGPTPENWQEPRRSSGLQAAASELGLEPMALSRYSPPLA